MNENYDEVQFEIIDFEDKDVIAAISNYDGAETD